MDSAFHQELDVTESLAATATPALLPESFWSILIRRTRYLAAIALSACVFLFLGWRMIAPPPEMAGISLLAWSSASAPLAAASVLVLLILVGLLTTLLVHPDAPHMGLFCAIFGMAALSIRGGTSHMLLQAAQLTDTNASVCTALAIECLLWASLFVIAEFIMRKVHDRYLANTHWITRSGPGVADSFVKLASRNTGGPIGISQRVSQTLRTQNLPRPIAAVLAVLYSGLIAFLLLFIFLQSQLKGQVLVACFVAFFLSTAIAYLAFPRVPALIFFLAVLVTAAAGYFIASGYHVSLYPGQGGFFICRALPIDFFVAGIPGSILGYYTGVRWALHSEETPSAA